MDDAAITIHAIDLGDPIADHPIESLLPYVEPDQVDRIRRFRQLGDACRSLYGELLARLALMDRYGFTNAEIAISRDEYGKPRLAGHGEIHFNVSHSGRWVLCMTAGHPVGIDVERMQRVEPGVERTCFSESECKALATLHGDEWTRLFYALWTAKESYIKMVGKGLSMPITDITVLPGAAGEIALTVTGLQAETVYFRRFFIDPAYMLTACAASPELPDSVRLTSAVNLTDTFLSGTRPAWEG